MPRLWPRTVGMSSQSQYVMIRKVRKVSQSNQKNTHAVVGKSCEDGEEAWRCEGGKTLVKRKLRGVVPRDCPATMGWYTVLLILLRAMMIRPTLG